MISLPKKILGWGENNFFQPGFENGNLNRPNVSSNACLMCLSWVKGWGEGIEVSTFVSTKSVYQKSVVKTKPK